MLSAIATLLGHDIALTSALDFGCGAGRLTLPLARRATRVVACDIAPTMLVHARENAHRAGLSNITFIENDELPGLAENQFDFICSMLVLQYIPPQSGYELIRTLLRLLAPSGIAALHVTLERPGGALRRYARMSRSAHAARPHHTQINEYDERAVHSVVEAAGARLVARFAMNQETANGAVLVIEKSPAPVGTFTE